MSHYEKIAVVIIRAAGCCIVIYALLAVAYGLLMSLSAGITSTIFNVLPCVFYLIVGVALFALSRPLASRVVKGIGDE